ncbi:CLUMA_CG000129, isoform A [Clunio marinus]|uniref:carnosine N-methyltransferase n=1 Tax=Clunio marinus TaxID=568069 RepID=A0A1J1HEJ0_9DIPT|nr:CLUMA_CG000129, isoform A [Clunio marinus]
MQDYEEERYFDEEERANFIKVISSFKFYRRNCFSRIDQRICYLSTLNQRQQKLLEKYRKYLNSIKECVEANNRVIEKMISNVDSLFINSKSNIEPQEIIHVQDPDSDKVHITIKQIVRDWTDLGAEEREHCYKPIIDEIVNHFDASNMKKNQFKILVPGAGLGRLVYEISLRGFFCEGNEFSLFMLIASNFILNRCLMDNQFEIYPFCHQFVNNLKREDSLVACRFPDMSAFQNPPKGEMNMIAGDFVQVYGDPSQENSWDCICCCFFIDCANNIVEFLEIIYKLLRTGGIFINYGPLLYHYCDVPNEFSIEPSYEDLREIIEKIGFKFLKENKKVKSKYSQNPSSMAQLEYNSVFFVVQKQSAPETTDDEQNGNEIKN